MGKAKADHTPAAAIEKMAAQPPLEDDAHWWPIEAALGWRLERVGEISLALIDLTNALEQGRLRCMIRSTAGARKRVAATAWRYRFILSFEMDGLHVLQRLPDIVEPVQGWGFHVWQPDLETGWPPGGARHG